jgi:heat shock protein HslJ
MTSPLRRLAHCLPVLAVLACAHVSTPRLDDRVYLSQRVTEDGTPRALVEGTRLQLQFEAGARFAASAGCNIFAGRYAIQGGRLVVSDAAQTLRGCEPPLHAQDDWYFGFLHSSPAIVVEGDTLVLDGSGTRIEYLDQEVATPDVSLTERTWTVEAIIEGDAATHAQWPTPASLVLRPDGTVTVDTGCNSGSGTYRVSGARVTFADVAVTERACTGDTARLERVVLGVLHGPQPVSWEITVDRLSLRGQGVGLDLVASGG